MTINHFYTTVDDKRCQICNATGRIGSELVVVNFIVAICRWAQSFSPPQRGGEQGRPFLRCFMGVNLTPDVFHTKFIQPFLYLGLVYCSS